jgi:hypothetical protein
MRTMRQLIIPLLCTALMAGQASSEETQPSQPAGPWMLTPIANRPSAAWLFNGGTGEVFYCEQNIPKEPKTSAFGICAPVPRVPLKPIDSSALTLPQPRPGGR